jgi:hypothetical protein
VHTFTKQPADNLDYDIDLSEWLTEGDTVTGAVATADAGITLGLTQFTDTKVKQWVSGGTHGVKYKITVNITTALGREKQHDFQIRVKEQ